MNIPETNAGAFPGKNILIVDDNRDSLDMLCLLLQSEGAVVQTALGGAEGLRKAEGKPVDLVISDLSMPEMDGHEFLLQLRRQPAHADVPAIALTGYGREEDVERAREVGFHRLLIKPLDFDALIREARAALGT